MRKGFIFDAALCVNCQACSAACMLENGLQHGVRRLYSWNESALPLLSVINLSMACNHCLDPSCARGCPAKAYTIEDNGVVMHHADRCMGCQYCTWRCPYDAPQVNPAQGYIEKCQFCAERLAKGQLPACVEVAQELAEKKGKEPALVFGDLADPNSEVRKLLQEHFSIRRKPELGTGPSVYYIL